MNGRYTVWVDPANAFHYRKAVIEKVHAEPVDVGGGVFLESEITEIGGVVIERFQDIPAITHIRKTVRKTLSDGSTSIDVHETSASEVRWNPDFEAMGAFVMDWPEGALVKDMDYGLTYVAANGQLTTAVDPLAVEEIERLVVVEAGTSEDATLAVRDAGTERASGQVSASRPVAATPHSARNWSPLVYGLVGVALGACVVCAVVYRRRRMGA